MDAVREPFDYLVLVPADDALEVDNPSGLYCRACRFAGMIHCANPELCGGLEPMKPKPESENRK